MNKLVNLPEPADRIVREFVDRILNIQPSLVEGVYLTGSISLNDFYSCKSDIDFIVLCKTLPDKDTFNHLHQIHSSVRKHFGQPDLNGCYLTSDSIQSNLSTQIRTVNYHEGRLEYGTFEMGPVTLAELRDNAITIYGQKAETLPLAIDHEQLNNFLYDNINTYWTKWIDNHSSYLKRKLLLFLFPRLTEWSVLGVARQLYTIQTGKIASKTEAGKYCMTHLPAEFHSIIKKALEIRKDNRTYPLVKSYGIKPSFRRVIETISCVNYMIAIIRNKYEETNRNI